MSQNDSVVREKQQHILVCLSSSPSNKRIIDEAANLANAFHAEFTALYVSNVRENSLNEVDRVRLQNNCYWRKYLISDSGICQNLRCHKNCDWKK